MKSILRNIGVALLSLMLVSQPAFAREAVVPRITAIRAQLFYERTASFSEDVLAGNFVLWNTLIGEGDAREASTSTLVTVEVRGQDVPVGAVRIRVSAVDAEGRSLGRRTIDVALYDDKTTFHAPLFLYGARCSEVTVTAQLIGAGVDAAPTRRTIPFHCGE
jgi:hypothetical protein